MTDDLARKLASARLARFQAKVQPSFDHLLTKLHEDFQNVGAQYAQVTNLLREKRDGIVKRSQNLQAYSETVQDLLYQLSSLRIAQQMDDELANEEMYNSYVKEMTGLRDELLAREKEADSMVHEADQQSRNYQEAIQGLEKEFQQKEKEYQDMIAEGKHQTEMMKKQTEEMRKTMAEMQIRLEEERQRGKSLQENVEQAKKDRDGMHHDLQQKQQEEEVMKRKLADAVAGRSSSPTQSFGSSCAPSSSTFTNALPVHLAPVVMGLMAGGFNISSTQIPTWNEFQHACKGMGLSAAQRSALYQQRKAGFYL
eukprot:ANDGO_01355.mRNA.1 hypothetical protein